ncbi:MAG: ATP synthase F0 subunit B, partial [Nitrospirota bacterium]
KPILRIIRKRSDAISIALDEAKALREKSERLLAEFNRAIAEARMRSKEIYRDLLNQGIEEQSKRIAASRKTAESMLEDAMTKINEEAEKARAKLREDVYIISNQIVERLVGKEL